MNDKNAVLDLILQAFGANAYPGDGFLQGSTQGCEPYDEVGPFQGQADWRRLDAEFLDTHAAALSFFSEAGLRFFLPAYLVADIEGQLNSADPVIPLTHGFSDIAVNARIRGREIVIRTGKSQLLNPRLYGAATFQDYVRYRLSVFTREEAAAIVAYLEFRRDAPGAVDAPAIDAALDSYWRDRALTAPSAEALQLHDKEKADLYG